MKKQVNNQAVKNVVVVSYEYFTFTNEVKRGESKGMIHSHRVRSYVHVTKKSGNEIIRYQIQLVDGQWSEGKSELVFMMYLRSLGIPVTTRKEMNPLLIKKYIKPMGYSEVHCTK